MKIDGNWRKVIGIEWYWSKLIEIEGTEKTWPCELALLALGFTGPEKSLAEQLGIEIDARSNYKATYGKYQTNRILYLFFLQLMSLEFL